jgi:uncharacterized protein involved in exopolysaccharide biosynthesis
VKYHQTLFDVMAKQYETAKMQESSAAPGVQIVDFPEVPLHKTWPSRLLFAIAGGVLGVFAALGTIFVNNRLRVLRADPERAADLQSLTEAFTRPSLRP